MMGVCMKSMKIFSNPSALLGNPAGSKSQSTTNILTQIVSMSIKDQIRSEIKRQIHMLRSSIMSQGDYGQSCHIVAYENILSFLDSLQEQPVSDHYEIEVEFRGEKVTISREFYRDGEMNYSTSEQDDNAIWSALRAWCEKKGITPFELYPKQPEQPGEGLDDN